MKEKAAIGTALAAGIFCFWAAGASARMVRDVKTQSSQVPPAYKVTAGCLPNKDQCTHKVGRLWFTVTNYGFFGNQTNPQGLRDCLTGGPSSSAEFPGGSEIEYLFQGALWVGAVVAGDTLTSIGTDGWVFDSDRGELHADCDQAGTIIRRSKNQASPYYDPVNGVSDLDLVAVMYDTLTDPAFVENPDPQDGKPFKPMGLKIIQSSYSWSAGWGQDWVMLDYKIVNLGRRPLTQVYVGVFVDADVGHPTRGNYFDDDLSGFKRTVPNETAPACPDTINLVYVQDNDGDPTGNSFTRTSPTAVTGIRVVRAPLPLNQVKTSFNWWTPNGTVSLDWGPEKVPARKNTAGGLGQPEGDAMKYFYLSNGETDYDQIWAALNHNSTDYGFGVGWQPPLTDPSDAVNIANGFDTRYVVGYGPFNLKSLVDDPSDTLRLTLGYIAGEGFHQDPLNFSSNLGAVAENFRNPVNIERYQNGLNFTSIATNARWVQRVFDNETTAVRYVCGPRPDTIVRRVGDGIPDFRGPQPPPAPLTQVITDQGEITLRWFGKSTENVFDDFTGSRDFEGYRVQMSPNGRDYTIIGSFDKVDWKLYYLDRSVIETTNTLGTWKPTNYPPMSFDEIQRRFGVLKAANEYTPRIVGWDTCLNKIDTITGVVTIGHPIDPDRFNAATQVRSSPNWPRLDQTFCNPDGSKTAFRVYYGVNTRTGVRADTIFYCAKQDYNLGLSQIKLYPNVTDPANDSSYWYQYRISGISPASPVYVAITPFDFGLLTKSNTLDPLEATPTSSAQLVYALPNETSRRYSYRVYGREANGEGWSNVPSSIMNFTKIQEAYAGRWDICQSRVISPDKFNAPDNPNPDPSRCNPDTLHRAISVRFCDNCGLGGAPVDSQFYFVLSDTFKISVYPNPYRVDNDYSHYENPEGVRQEADRHRKLNFINLPAKCKIRIYTLDGDLVEEINHDKAPSASDAGYDSWNLLTRNAQVVSAGLYLYTVQSSDGIWTEDGLKNTYVGKIVIIK